MWVSNQNSKLHLGTSDSFFVSRLQSWSKDRTPPEHVVKMDPNKIKTMQFMMAYLIKHRMFTNALTVVNRKVSKDHFVTRIEASSYFKTIDTYRGLFNFLSGRMPKKQ